MMEWYVYWCWGLCLGGGGVGLELEGTGGATSEEQARGGVTQPQRQAADGILATADRLADTARSTAPPFNRRCSASRVTVHKARPPPPPMTYKP